MLCLSENLFRMTVEPTSQVQRPKAARLPANTKAYVLRKNL